MGPARLPERTAVRRRLRNPGLVITFALSSLATFLVIGGVLTYIAFRHVEQRELREAQEHATFLADWLGRSGVSAKSLDQPSNAKRSIRLHGPLTARLLEFPIFRLKVWSDDGTIIYSDDHRLIGQRFELERGLDGALRGNTVNLVSDEGDEVENRYEHDLSGKFLETYVPLYLPGDKRGSPSGAVELYQHYAAVQEEIDGLLRTLVPTLVLGLAVLYILQLPLARRIDKVLSTKNEQLEDQAERLRDQAARLEHQAERLANHLQIEREAVVKLEEVNQMKSEFVDVASHELKNPVSAVRGAIKTLLLPSGESPEARDEMLTIADRQVDRLAELSDRLLLSERLDNGRFPLALSRFSLDELIRDVVAGLGDRATRVDISVASDVPPLVSDRYAVQQIVANLIENACKFSPPTSPCEVRVGTRGRSVTISVRDHGRGIPDDSRERIFERFYRVSHAPNGTVPGVGLGLSLVKELVDQLEGTITVTSRVGQGSDFTVSLPRRHSQAPAADKQRARTQG